MSGDPAGTSDGSALRQHTRNGYGLLRLCLASLVILQHSLALTGHEDNARLGLVAIGEQASFGDIAVGGFFALSGFLLSASVRRNTPGRFLRLRFFRLFPGFWATLVVVAFVLAPLIALAAGTLSGYRLVGDDSAIGYVGWNAALLVVQPTIGDVLSNNPYPTGLDGSLWTLLPEFTCYVTLLLIVLLGRRLRTPAWLLPVLGCAAALLVYPFALIVLDPASASYLGLVAGLPAAFFAGSAMAELGLQRHATWPLVASLAVANLLVILLGLWLPLGPPLLAALVVLLGAVLTSGWPARVGTRNDFSYGVYLYHFPVIQLLVALGLGGLSAASALLLLSPLALLATAPLAVASWYFVEAPAQRRGRRRPPAPKRHDQVADA